MENVKIGVGRVSTDEQNPQRQIDAFLAEGIEERYIFVDKCTGGIWVTLTQTSSSAICYR